MDALRYPNALQEAAVAYVVLGDVSAAISALDARLNISRGFLNPTLLAVDPLWDPLRDHPSFQALLDQYDSDNGER